MGSAYATVNGSRSSINRTLKVYESAMTLCLGKRKIWNFSGLRGQGGGPQIAVEI